MALLLVTGGAWILSPTPAPTAGAVSPIMRQEVDAAIAALTPRKRSRPLIAIIGINDATEPGWVRLYPALKVVPDATVAEFDARHPDGADYVVVPAMSRDDDPTILPWIKSQAAKGAMVIGVCAGAKVVGEAGLLDGTRATTHWYHLDEVRRKPHDPYRSGSEVRGRQGRCNDDRDHGVHADDAHRDRGHRRAAQKAESVARDLGLPGWGAGHDSAAFRFTRPFATTAMGNTLAVWNRERLGLEVQPGTDEVCRQGPAPRRTASRARRSRTGTGPRRRPCRHLGPLRNAHGRSRRHATRTPEADRSGLRPSPDGSGPGLSLLHPSRIFDTIAGATGCKPMATAPGS
ncbi:MAG: DJ-1/PfpI family protein [Microvirga sp.]